MRGIQLAGPHASKRRLFTQPKSVWGRIAGVAIAAVCATSVHAAGITTHWYIGDLVWAEVATERPALAAFLANYYDMFRRGTVFPDAAQRYLNRAYGGGEQKFGPGDVASHELNLNSDFARYMSNAGHGLVTEMLDQMAIRCAAKLKSQKLDDECGSALAFALGMVNHMIADAPWHATWIAHTLDQQCPNLRGDTFKNTKDKEGKDPSRHSLSDQDIDICLAARLTGNPDAFLGAALAGALPGALFGGAAGAVAGGVAGAVVGAGAGLIAMQIPYDLTLSLTQKTASPTGHPIQLICPEGKFFDFIDGGSCWSCPVGYIRNPIAGVKAADACVTVPGLDYERASRHHKAALGTHPCPRGQFVHLGLRGSYGYCYSCPGGYDRTAEAIDGGKACSKWVAEALKPATAAGKAGILCPGGEFAAPTSPSNIACFACPSDAPTHYNQYPVNDKRVCQKVATVPCSTITGVAANPLRYVRLLSDMANPVSKARTAYAWKFLKPAYSRVFKGIPQLGSLAADTNAAGIDRETDDYVVNAMKEPLVHFSDLYLNGTC